MLFSELFEQLQKLTPEQLRTEVFVFEEGAPVAWANSIALDSENRPHLTGTVDLG